MARDASLGRVEGKGWGFVFGDNGGLNRWMYGEVGRLVYVVACVGILIRDLMVLFCETARAVNTCSLHPCTLLVSSGCFGVL